MAWITIREHAVLSLPDLDLVGDIKYDSRQHALVLIDPSTADEEVLTLSLLSSGFVAAMDEVFVKNWSEHSGLAAALVAAQIGHRVETITIGPNGLTAYRMLISDDPCFEDTIDAPRPGHDAAFDDQVVAAATRLALLDRQYCEEFATNKPGLHATDDHHPDLPPELGEWALETCSECQPIQFCKSELLFHPDDGLNRVYYCVEHGLVSIDNDLE